MICSSSLADDLSALILDTSVIINLHACSIGDQIIAAIPNDIAVPDIVVQELQHETGRANGEHRFLQDLIALKRVRSLPLSDAAWLVFERLTTATSSLGDGEAATIALAATSGFRPVIDDVKGRKAAELLIRGIAPAWSLDVLLHPEVRNEVGVSASHDAIYNALRIGRMRIDDERCDAVVELIGVERAITCTSLPGYKVRREAWKTPRSEQ